MNQTLVTGGTGFVGSAIVRALVKNTESVVVMTRKPTEVPRERRVPGAHYIYGDVFDSASVQAALNGCDALVHAVQFENAPFENPRRGLTYEKIDGEGTGRLMEVVAKSEIQRVIYISGAGTREGRIEPWFKAKLKAEKAVKESGKDWTIFQPSWIYGPQDWSLNRILAIAKFSPLYPLIGDGEEKIQPVHADDVAQAVAYALNAKHMFNKTYEVGGPQTLSMKEILQTCKEVQGSWKPIVPHPKALMKAVASILQYLPTPPLTPDGIDFITMNEPVDPEPLFDATGQKCRTLREGLSSYL